MKRSMRTALFLALAFILCLSHVPQGGAGDSGSSSEIEALAKIAEVGDLYVKKITLEYLADTRSRELLTKAIAKFDPQRRKNFHSNVVGKYRHTILDNFNTALESREKVLLELLSKDAYAAVPAVLDAVAEVTPEGLQVAFYKVFHDLKTRLKYDALHGEGEGAKEILAQVSDVVGRIKTLAAGDAYDTAHAMFGQLPPDAIPVYWYDDWSYPVIQEPDQAPDKVHGQLDLNAATVEELAAVEGVGEGTAAKIVAYRKREGGFVAVSELRRIEGIGDGRYRSLSPLLRVVPARKPLKKWTLMVYINSDNDLEAAGLGDINEMEIVGSTTDVNVLVQIDRMKPGHDGDTLADGNWTGTRRYYVLKDDDGKRITSPIVADMGETDMGDPKTLVDFGTYCVENFPAKRYALVIWNHGSGWTGIAYDDESGNHLSTPEMMEAINTISDRMRQLQPEKKKIDIVDLDACLMALLEVAYQIRDRVDILVASQVEEPGRGMPYDKYLAELTAHPGMAPKRLAKIMVETFVESYALGGSQNHPRLDNSSVTKSAIKLDRLGPLVKAVNELSVLLGTDYELYSRILEDNRTAFKAVRKYNDDFADLYHLAVTLKGAEGCSDDVKAVCDRIIDTIGYRKKGVDTIDREVVVKRKRPGQVVWSINGGQTPPTSRWPRGSHIIQSRYVVTPLGGPDGEGWYSANLGNFAPIPNPWTQRNEVIKSIEYSVLYQNGRQGKRQVVTATPDRRIAKNFPDTSPLLAEGHTQGQGNSHGIAIYLPYPRDYYRPYENLAFAHDTGWDELVRNIPTFERKAKVLLSGLVVRSDYGSVYEKAFEELGMKTQMLSSPALFGFKYKDILRSFASDGVVVVDTMVEESVGYIGPDPDDLRDFVTHGGKLILVSMNEQKKNTFTDFFRATVGADYFREVEQPCLLHRSDTPLAKFTVGGAEGDRSYAGTIFLRPMNGAVPFVEGPGGRVAGTYRAVGKGGVIYLGFRWESITDEKARLAVLKSALAKLGVE